MSVGLHFVCISVFTAVLDRCFHQELSIFCWNITRLSIINWGCYVVHYKYKSLNLRRRIFTIAGFFGLSTANQFVLTRFTQYCRLFECIRISLIVTGEWLNAASYFGDWSKAFNVVIYVAFCHYIWISRWRIGETPLIQLASLTHITCVAMVTKWL